MVEFLRIDEDLIAAAAEGNDANTDDRAALRRWVLGLAPRAKDEWLRRAVEDPDLALGGELLRVFRAEANPTGGKRRRTPAELRALAEKCRGERERAEARRAANAKKASDATRKRRLDALATRVETACGRDCFLEALVDKSAYEEATKLAIDLRDLATRDGVSVTFAARFEAMRKRKLRRRGFFDRWKRENGPQR